LNWQYSVLTWAQKAAFHRRFSTSYRGYTDSFDEGNWRLDVGGVRMVVPLRRASAWLDWDAALSIHGHEPELKKTYEFLIRLPHPPRLVFDIGANYGTHSIVFLLHGIQTISFEPNVRCHEFFRDLCAANGLKPTVESTAVGAANHAASDLWYLAGQEWLGTTDAAVKETLGAAVIKTIVTQVTLDEYIQRTGSQPDLVKIDTEGADLQVLKGAAATLAIHRPLVLLESWRSPERRVLWSFLNAQRYCLCPLPLASTIAPEPLTLDRFCDMWPINFAALPAEMLECWPPAFPHRRL
jgi:FkbM family methyltransferase